LCCGRPDHVTWSIAVAKAGTVENDDSVAFGRQIDQPARLKILDHAAVAVEKDQRFACATFDIVQPNAVYVQELTMWRVVARGFLREIPIHQGGHS
jgi:hypothetical protein